ncbi:MAG: type II toxin-antitoxin system Phd/YefM family antitoxin [Candidatus Dormibacteraceae bacterium]
MVGQIGVRQLREGLSKALRRVRAGEILEITDHGRPVARIVPLASFAAGLEDLVAAGTLIAPLGSGPMPEPLDLPSTMTSEEAVAILRGA